MSASPTIRMLGPTDASVLNCVAPGVFDNAIDPRWTAKFLADPRHHMAVALLGQQVVGMASAVHYVHPDKPPELWVNEVGVAPAHQGQGTRQNRRSGRQDSRRRAGGARHGAFSLFTDPEGRMMGLWKQAKK